MRAIITLLGFLLMGKLTVDVEAIPESRPICNGAGFYNIAYNPEGDCTRFIQCSMGIAYEKHCPIGDFFNPDPAALVCQADYRCGSWGLECDPDRGLYLLPHPSLCSQFYICSFGTLVGPQSCPDGKWFHSVSGDCVPPEESDCTWESLPTTPEPSTTVEPSPCPCPQDTNSITLVKHADPAECGRFCLCVMGEFEDEFTCPDGHRVDDDVQECIEDPTCTSIPV